MPLNCVQSTLDAIAEDADEIFPGGKERDVVKDEVGDFVLLDDWSKVSENTGFDPDDILWFGEVNPLGSELLRE